MAPRVSDGGELQKIREEGAGFGSRFGRCCETKIELSCSARPRRRLWVVLSLYVDELAMLRMSAPARLAPCTLGDDSPDEADYVFLPN